MTYLKFINDVLLPCASQSLRCFYEQYCNGTDIGIETKTDDSPASLADRETEKLLRDLILDEYPQHGIWGEEFGTYNTDRDYIWVLDPLDGTREFLSKSPGKFGVLIGLLYKGNAVLGAISDPLSNTHWVAETNTNIPPTQTGKTLEQSIVACTNPTIMFPTPEEQAFIHQIRNQSKAFVEHLNCMGFAQLADGKIDAVVEADLSLHDLGALIPVLQNAGKTIIDFNGNDYTTYAFKLKHTQETTPQNTKKFSVIATQNVALAHDILKRRTYS